MKFRNTFIAFLFFVVLLGILFIFEGKKQDKSDAEARLVDVPVEEITRIDFDAGKESLIFSRSDSQDWRIVSPLDVPADSIEVGRLADTFASLKIERVVEEIPDRIEKYSIPQKTLTLTMKDGSEPITIEIGMENPFDNTFFAKRKDENRVVLIPASLSSVLEKGFFDFRRKDIFYFDADAVETLSAGGNGLKWTAEKSGRDWYLSQPVKSLAKNSTIDSIVRALADLRAEEFVAEEKSEQILKETGLDHPQYGYEVKLSGKDKSLIFNLAEAGENLYATTSQTDKIIRVNNAILNTLNTEIEKLRENRIADFYSWNIQSIELKNLDTLLSAAKDDSGNWILKEYKDRKADESSINAFLRLIENLDAKEFIDPPLNLKSNHLDPPDTEIHLVWKQGEEQHEITLQLGLHDEEKGLVIIRNPRFDYLFRTEDKFLEAIPKSIEDWSQKEKDNTKK